MYRVLLGCVGAIALLAGGATASRASESAAELATLQSKVEQSLKDEGLVGAVWVTLAPSAGEIVGAAGLKDASIGAPMEPQHLVQVGSIAKTLLAIGVLRLVTEGRLSLDEPVSRILPGLRFDNPWARTDPITLRHLLDHTSGLDDAKLWQVFSTKAQPDTPLVAAFPANEKLLTVRARPGSRFSYSNTGYGLLGMVIESVTGERYESYLSLHVLRPLQMTDSTFSFVSQTGPDAEPRLSMGHFEHSAPHAAVPTYLRPASQFTTSASDMAQLMRFLLGDGRISNEVFIDPGLFASMGAPHMTEAAVAGLQVGYGLGLARRDRGGVVGLCHGGSMVGFRAMMCVYREQQKGFSIALNADNEAADYERFNQLLIDSLDMRSSAPAPAASAPDLRGWEGFYVPSPNRFASFVWLDTVFGFVRLKADSAGLRLTSLQSPEKQLTPQGGLLFRASDRVVPSHVLLKAADGARVLSDGQRSYERIPLIKLAGLWISICLGALAVLYILLSMFARIMRRRSWASHPMFIPFLATLALLLPIPLFFGQSFVQVGDVTAASVTLAMVTVALPLAMLVGLFQLARAGLKGPRSALNLCATIAALQAIAALAVYGLMPLRLWAL